MRDQFNFSGDFRSASLTIVAEHRAERPPVREAWRRFEKMPLNGPLPEHAPLPSGSIMAWSPNPLFVAREDNLRALARLVGGGGSAVISQTAAASGLGGVGKTQLAVEFAHRYGQYFAGGIFWINCADPDTIAEQVASFGGVDGLDLHPEFSLMALPDRVRLVRQAWEDSYPRLLIFDNCEAEQTLAEWRPKSGAAKLLITSRRAQWSAGLSVKSLSLNVLDRCDSIRLVTAFDPGLITSGDVLDEIAAELGDLPLALHMAGAFLRRYRHSSAGDPARYLARLRSAVLDHPSLISGDWSPTGHDQHVARTFEVSYCDLDAVQDAGPLQVLTLLCCYAPGEPIPRTYIQVRGDAEETDEDLEVAREDAFGRLLELGLIEQHGSNLFVHRLISAFVRSRMDPHVRIEFAKEVLLAARASNRMGDARDIAGWFVHLMHVTEHALAAYGDLGDELLCEVAQHHYLNGAYEACRKTNVHRLTRAEAKSPPDQATIAAVLNDLAVSLRPIARDEAIALLKRSIEYALCSPDKHELSLIKSYVNLAEALSDDDEALRACEEARRRFLLVWRRPETPLELPVSPLLREADVPVGQMDPDHLWIRIICAIARRTREGDWCQAEQRLLEDLRPENPDEPDFRYWEVLRELGCLRRTAGDARGALRRFEAAKTILLDRYGPETPLLGDVHFLAGEAYANLGDHQAASTELQRAVHLAETALGWGHSGTVAASNALLKSQTALGDFQSVKTHMASRLVYAEAQSGSGADDISYVLFVLGVACFRLGKRNEAVKHLRRALKLAKRSEQPDTDKIYTINAFLKQVDRPGWRNLHA